MNNSEKIVDQLTSVPNIPKWSAHWIWMQNNKNYSFVCFRKKFSLQQTGLVSMLHITANNDYQVYLNGKRIGFGPPFSHSRYKRYDTYDVTAQLAAGENCLSVIVHHCTDNDSVNPEYRGLLCQLDIQNNAVCVSDTSWKAFFCGAFEEPHTKMGYTFRPEYVDARKYPHGWKEIDYDDSGWSYASLVIGSSIQNFWNCDHHPSRVFPWTNLIPSELEPLRYTKCLPLSVVSHGEVVQKIQPTSSDTAVRMSLESILPLEKAVIENLENLLVENGDVRILGSNAYEEVKTFDGLRDVTFILDFGRIMNARLGFRISSTGNAIIDIGYSNVLDGNRIVPYESNQTPRADQYISSDGQQTWLGFNWRQFRYVQLTFRYTSYIHGGGDPFKEIILHEIWAEQVEYPFVLKGGFECNDPLVNRAVNATRLSTRLNVVGNMMDNASRERRHHVGDCLALLWSIYSFFGVSGMVKRYFRHAEENRRLCGNYERATGLRGLVIDSCLDVPSFLYEHYMITGDKELLEEMWPGLELTARFIESCIDDTGMIESMPYYLYFDWADICRGRYNFLMNAIAMEALESICKIFKALNIDRSVDRRLEQVSCMRNALGEKWFDSGKGVFLDLPYDSTKDNHISQHTNSYAIYARIASPEQMASVCKAYEEHPQWFAMANAGWKYMPIALLRAGRTDLCVRWIHYYFGKWFDNNIDTVAENWSLYGETTSGYWRSRNSRAVAQAAGVVGLPYAILTELCGIQPMNPGFKTIGFAPNPGCLESFKGSFPIEGGLCSLNYRLQDSKQHINISVPDCVRSMVVDLPSCSAKDTILVDGEKRDADEMHIMPYGKQVPRLYLEGKTSATIVINHG